MNMKRDILQSLAAWKNKEGRKPLILLGARQVGKTHILKEFGKQHFSHTAYINCDNNELAKDLFTQDYDIKRILIAINSLCGVPIIPGKTLIILDEIQEISRGLNSLKYFCENAPEYHVAAAGSLLGITLHHGESFPVGKVNTINLYPMSFGEFLTAKGRDDLRQLLNNHQWDVISSLKSLFIQCLREYYFVGGMPEAVLKFITTSDTTKVREVQNEILLAYEKDISKHAQSNEAIRISQVWASIPSQLAKENSRFIYGAVRNGARAKDFEVAIQWLIDASLVIKVDRVSKASFPLKVYANFNCFKLYMLDCGLLGAINEIPASMILLPNAANESKGYFTENFVCTQLKALSNLSIYYFSKENSTQEVDFMLQTADEITAIEVKAEENLQSKSLKAFHAENPEVKCIRTSMANHIENDWLTNVPLYAISDYISMIR